MSILLSIAKWLIHPNDTHSHGTTTKPPSAAIKQVDSLLRFDPKGIRLHGTTVEVLDAHSELPLHKLMRPMDIHCHGTTAEL
jgi:hypothetical protein